AREVVLGRDVPGRYGSRLGGLQAVVERAGWEGNADSIGETRHFRHVLGLPEQELLAVEVPDGRVSLHDEARLGATHTGRPGARQVDGQSPVVEQGRVLAEVPHVAAVVLGK